MKIMDTIKKDPKYSPQNSMEWFRRAVAGATRGHTNSLMHTRAHALNVTPVPGNMYAFRYRPKGIDTLPFYDAYPLIIPFRVAGPDFWGLNFHYLHPNVRGGLLESLMEFKDSRSRMIFTWKVAKAKGMPGIDQAVKHYLLPNIQSTFYKFEEEEWPMAIYLPFERFVGMRKSDVWKR